MRQKKSVLEKPAEEGQVLSVSAFLDYVTELITVQPVLVQGEVTGWKEHPSGIYFSLKDPSTGSGQAALMDCYINPYAWRSMILMVEDGMEVKVGGLPSIYKPKGRFSFRVQTMELAGEGTLKKAYELLKQKLEAEGLFARKRELPEFVLRIGIITSRTGAVIDDFRRNLAKLGFSVQLCDVRVEGIQAVRQIISAIKQFQKQNIDVLVVMRGGGSLEDLQPFNSELVARAIFSSNMPTIVAIGHDRDVPIAQMVADIAPSTPTAAAMTINNTWARLTQELPAYTQTLVHVFERALDQYRDLAHMDGVVPIFQNALTVRMQKVASYESYLSAVSPERNLQLGYSIVTDGQGRVIKKVKDVTIGQQIGIRLNEGKVTTKVTEITHAKD